MFKTLNKPMQTRAIDLEAYEFTVESLPGNPFDLQMRPKYLGKNGFVGILVGVFSGYQLCISHDLILISAQFASYKNVLGNYTHL